MLYIARNIMFVISKKGTINSKIFARVLFTRNFVGAKFRENNTLEMTVSKSSPSRKFERGNYVF